MNRREAIHNVAFLVGGAITASTLFALTEGCNTKPGATSTSAKQFLGDDVRELIAEFAETIIPKTSTPGAKDAKVDDFIQVMLRDCYPPADQKKMLDGIASFQKECSQVTGKKFAELSVEERTKFMTGIESRIYTKPVVEKPTISDDHNVNTKKNTREDVKPKEKPKDEPYHYYKVLKELTLIGYFTSEVGCTQALAYVKVPGSYNGSVKLKPGQKAWAQS